MSLDNPTTLKEAAEAILAGRITSVEMTTAALARAKSSHERLNAFIEIEEGPVLEAARAADVALAAGRTVGPLHGVPLAHKDMYDRAGFVTGCGSKIRKGHVATSTSTVMQRLQAAGALSIGRLNMSEFAMGPTGHNFHHGRALNPIDAARITGGSSSGSGSAVGGGVVLAALGSDTGGSIRLPAACCGTVGIKPTQGRVSRHGAMPLSFSQDCVGPLARSVADAYLLLQLIAGPDGHDTTCMDADKPGALLSDLSSLRIGIAGGPFADGLESDVAGGMETAIRALSPDVAGIAAAPLPDLSAIAELANAVAMAEAGTVHFDWMRERPEDYGPQIRMRLSQSLAIPAPIYLRALQMRSVMLREFLETTFAGIDVLIAPTMPFIPPLSSEVDVGTSPTMNAVVSAMTAFTRPFSYLGLPVVTVPVSMSAGGLPIALQIVARPWREDLAASVALRLERAVGLTAFTDPSLARPAA
ncbi:MULTISPECIES: amidase [Rhizobium]|uniref:Indoleacetamide hydrolase n=1 Tax=Rhizobium rhododendri TaxID=2506430 RepID=A0ABY8IQ64_9HYPH|nr:MULTISPECIES: amidase [Rhizobium]MBO9134709.1 amidase [Rhizobium sp. B209b/85]MBZ5761260.1 amidase [Rhizobium sp. VS19-DR96]MBZ5767014.1 amidase [Rhizobium sp. VS19-DR129.2]MBZ5774899.1 amidase [Rhizobium sp. VS19-DRK62.2]MBZ5785692.1 amidase [Rhizobium sp. VS19-DR121]